MQIRNDNDKPSLNGDIWNLLADEKGNAFQVVLYEHETGNARFVCDDFSKLLKMIVQDKSEVVKTHEENKSM